jgi:hypothetical protein
MRQTAAAHSASLKMDFVLGNDGQYWFNILIFVFMASFLNLSSLFIFLMFHGTLNYFHRVHDFPFTNWLKIKDFL